MIIPDIINEVVCRLQAIAAYTEAPTGHVYYYTPDAVYKARRILDAEITNGPIYSVYRNPKVNNSRTPDSAYEQWAIEIVVDGAVEITDFDNPMLDAEKCLVDIEAALCGSSDPRQHNTLNGTAQAFILDSDNIDLPETDDVIARFTATFAAIVSAKRGTFN